MGLLGNLEKIVDTGKDIWENTLPAESQQIESYTRYEGMNEKRCAKDDLLNSIIKGDNLQVCKMLLEEGMEESIDMIYVDPPFFSNAKYKSQLNLTLNDSSISIKQDAYTDSWKNGIDEYLIMLCARLFAFKELLKEDGCIWVHLDWHAVHYIKIILDEVFGVENFVNEIIWNYKSGGAGKRRFSRKHDTLLFYSKSDKYYFKPLKEKSYNRGLKPYNFKGVSEYKDDIGWHTLVNMKDVWQIDMVGRTSSERTGYATQKPEALIDRIIESCTEEGDICADFFGGSAAMACSAYKNNRRWISCDTGKLSSLYSIKRMLRLGASFKYKNTEKQAIKNEGFSNDGNIEILINGEDIPGSNNKLITIEIKKYRLPDDASIPVKKKDIRIIENINKKKWLQLIDIIAVDFQYDGSIITPHLCWKRSEQIGVEESNTIKLEKIVSERRDIALKIVDIFGNCSYAIKTSINDK